LAGIVVGAWLAGDLARRESRRGLALAAFVAAALLTPHVLWLSSGHGAALAYASQQGHTLSGAERAWNVASFLAQQLRFMLGPFLFFGLLTLLPGARGRLPEDDHRRHRAWLIGLVAFPLFVTVLTGPVFGIALQNHWGFQALQFVSLWLACLLRPRAPVAGVSWFVAALALHAAFLGLALSGADIALGKTKRRLDLNYPAQALADAVQRDWNDDTLCPLRFVVGPSFEAGMISVYTGGQAGVVEDGSFKKSPWIRPEDAQRFGAVYVSADPAELPSNGVSRVGFMDVTSVSGAGKSPIYWAIAPPEGCSHAAIDD
jgi:hypothetical protein